jgi:hypothetical protein
LEDDETVTLAFDFLNEENMDAVTHEMTALADIPSVNYTIDFKWKGESLQTFSQVPRLSLCLRFPPSYERPLTPALSAERCNEISNTIRGCADLKKLRLDGAGATVDVDLVKSVVAGLDKNASVQELRIDGISTGYHDVLWKALSQNENSKLESLRVVWNKNEARVIWEGLLTNTTVCDFKFSHSLPGPPYSLGDAFDALAKRNKLLRETAMFCKTDRNPREFMDKLCELSEESSQYYTDAVERFTNSDDPGEEQDQNNLLLSSFSAQFVAIRHHLPGFVKTEISLKIPLKDATDEDMLTLDLDAYGDMANESRETILRVCSESMRRNRELERRCREGEEANRT